MLKYPFKRKVLDNKHFIFVIWYWCLTTVQPDMVPGPIWCHHQHQKLKLYQVLAYFDADKFTVWWPQLRQCWGLACQWVPGSRVPHCHWCSGCLILLTPTKQPAQPNHTPGVATFTRVPHTLILLTPTKQPAQPNHTPGVATFTR